MSNERTKTIELDCPPGHPRPGHLIEDVIKDTGLPSRECAGTFFGNWTWDYSDVSDEVWENAQPILKKRIESLYTKGVIRYGSW